MGMNYVCLNNAILFIYIYICVCVCVLGDYCLHSGTDPGRLHLSHCRRTQWQVVDPGFAWVCCSSNLNMHAPWWFKRRGWAWGCRFHAHRHSPESPTSASRGLRLSGPRDGWLTTGCVWMCRPPRAKLYLLQWQVQIENKCKEKSHRDIFCKIKFSFYFT